MGKPARTGTRRRDGAAKAPPAPAALPPRPIPPDARLAAIVVLAVMPLWLLLSWAGGALGMAPRFAFLIDFAALGAFGFAFILLFRVWQRTRSERN